MIAHLDQTTIAKITTQADMDKFVASLGLSTDNIIIKPNWVDGCLGTHTEAKVLDLFLGSLKNKKIYFVESYTFWRNQKSTEEGEDSFSSSEAQFETGQKHWDFFKAGDDWFLKTTGIDKVIEKYKVTYINITNELWAGRESQIPLIPQVLYDLRGSDFISFAKLKGDGDYGATLSIKNLFGLYPDPHRMKKYHGENDELIKDSILKINQIYRPLFNHFSIIEGVYFASYVNWSKHVHRVFEDLGVIIGGQDPLEVDDTALQMTRTQPSGALKTLWIDYQKIFGGNFQSLNIPSKFIFKF